MKYEKQTFAVLHRGEDGFTPLVRRVGGLAVGVACGLLMFGCGGSSGSGSGGGVELDVAGCAGFGIDDAAAILAVPATALQDSSQPLGDDGRWCIFSGVEDSSLAVNFSVTQADTVERAIEEFQQFRGNVQVAVGILGEKGQAAHDVEGIGDEALWTPVPGALHVRVGRYSVQVNPPSDEETQIRIARRILGGG